MRKEYNDRWNSPLVNLPFTEKEYEEQKNKLNEQYLCFKHIKFRSEEKFEDEDS